LLQRNSALPRQKIQLQTPRSSKVIFAAFSGIAPQGNLTVKLQTYSHV